MTNEDLLRCPLLQGLDAMHRAELIGLLNDSNLRDRLENCLAQLAPEVTNANGSASDTVCPDFQKQVHGWTPEVSLWRRSAKE